MHDESRSHCHGLLRHLNKTEPRQNVCFENNLMCKYGSVSQLSRSTLSHRKQLFYTRMSRSPSSTTTILVYATHSTFRPHTRPASVCVHGYWMQNHEVIDEVLLHELGDRQSRTFYTLPPLPQTPTSFHKTLWCTDGPVPLPLGCHCFSLFKIFIWKHTVADMQQYVERRMTYKKVPGWIRKMYTCQYSKLDRPIFQPVNADISYRCMLVNR